MPQVIRSPFKIAMKNCIFLLSLRRIVSHSFKDSGHKKYKKPMQSVVSLEEELSGYHFRPTSVFVGLSL
jgi:hypothetical protein